MRGQETNRWIRQWNVRRPSLSLPDVQWPEAGLMHDWSTQMVRWTIASQSSCSLICTGIRDLVTSIPEITATRRPVQHLARTQKRRQNECHSSSPDKEAADDSFFTVTAASLGHEKVADIQVMRGRRRVSGETTGKERTNGRSISCTCVSQNLLTFSSPIPSIIENEKRDREILSPRSSSGRKWDKKYIFFLP